MLAARSMLWALTATSNRAAPLCTSIETFTIMLTSAGRIPSFLAVPEDPQWPSGSLLLLKAYPYTGARYMDNKYYLLHRLLSRMSHSSWAARAPAKRSRARGWVASINRAAYKEGVLGNEGIKEGRGIL